MATSRNMSWNSNAQYALGLYKLITKSLGIWPFDYQSILSKIQTIIIIILEITMAASILIETYLNCGGLHNYTQMYSLTACCFIVVVKLTTLRINNDKILAIISSSISDWTTVLHPKASEVMKKNAKLARFVCLFQMISGYITVIMFVMGPLAFLALQVNIPANVTGNISDVIFQPLPLQTICVFGEMSTHTYAAIYMLQAIQMLSTCTGNVGCDCYFFGITLHVAGQLEWLGIQFQTLDIEATEHECTKTLAVLVKKHNQLMQFAHYLEESFNICIVLILSVNMVQICLNGIQMIVSLRNGDTATVINGVIILYILNLQIFLYSYAGDRLSSGIANLQTAIYCSQWYNLPQRTIKDLAFVMLRAGKKFDLTAGKIYSMNIDSFKNILKAMLSYFSVMQAMFEA